VNPEWKDKVGVNTSLEWPAGLGGKGNEGVAALTSRTSGAIGYVEYAYAKQNKLNYAEIKNQDGVYVSPDSKSFQAAAANADWSKAAGFDLLLTNQPGKDSWPITGATFILMYKKQDKPEIAKQVLDFFAWAYKHGGSLAEGLDYVPMPTPVVDLVEGTWKKDITAPNGQPVWSGPAS
jgi:phosphate transport system substrate-binding protein